MENFTIFVSIASYRDPKCKSTIQNLFQNAKNPHRVFIGACQQNNFNISSENCLSSEQEYSENIRTLSISYQDAKGPTYARYLCSTLYQNEDFFLQIDAHSKFVKNWDDLLLKMYFQLKKIYETTKIILSTYPGSIEDYTPYPTHTTVPHIESAYQKNGIIRYHLSIYRKTSILPKPSFFIAAGFLFTTGFWLKDVPFDPNLDYLFIGEEILLSVRSYTKGWHIFTPNKEIIFHHYLRQDENKIWDDKTYSAKNAEHRLKNFFKLDPKSQESAILDKYGLGNTRDLKEYLQKIGIIKAEKKIDNEYFTPKNEILTSSNNMVHLVIFIFILLGVVLVYSILYNFYYTNK